MRRCLGPIWLGLSALNRKTLNCGNLPDTSAKSIRQLSDEELHKFIAGWKDGTELRIRGDVEVTTPRGMGSQMGFRSFDVCPVRIGHRACHKSLVG